MPVKKISQINIANSKSGKLAPKAESDDLIIPDIAKIKKLDIPDDVEEFAVPEEKSGDEPLAEDTEDESGAEISLDSEEINPFGDKWEE